MPDKKLTDNEIKKGLEKWIKNYDGSYVNFKTLGNALDLINRLQAEKEALINGQETLQKYIVEQKVENERLKKENGALQAQNDYWRTEVKTTRLELIKAPKTAVKEFDKRLKEDCLSYPIEDGDLTMLVDIDGYNNLLKELVGEDNETKII